MQAPRGTRDLFGEELQSIRHVMRRMEEVFKRYGYEEIETPIFEHLELFTKKSGSSVVRQLYAFKDKSSRDLALRPEITAPVARVYIQRLRSRPKPVKLYYFGSCFRYEEPQSKRWRQFLQSGAEILGTADPAADAEIAALTGHVMEDLGFADFELRLGHIRLLRELLSHAGVKGEAQDPILRAVDSKEEKRISEEIGRAGIKPAEEKLFRELISLRGEVSILEQAAPLLRKIPRATAALQNLRAIIGYLPSLGVKNFSLDLGIARGLDYYTDFVFEAYLGGVQVAGGGRYDELVEQLGGEPTPAVGVAFGIDRIAQTLLERGMVPLRDRLDCLVLPVNEEVRAEAMRVVTELRRAGLAADIDLVGRKFTKAMEYANAIGVKRVVVVGPKELKQGRVILKDMITGEQEVVPREELPRALKSEA
ncbi:MAG: histidine--tRNA ligase [Candidatus Hadarchaeum sp.]|uniref:histidine--tRNA ligase n=1 Tax=Candidatus Hadarchaeum sp. TaxID=2883567 RepID=UPI003D0BB4D9